MVAKDEKAVFCELDLVNVFAVFFQHVYFLGLGFCFQECLKACFVFGNARVRFARYGFFENLLPCIHVGSHVVECAAVNLDVQGRVRWTIQDGVEGYVPAKSMRKKKAANDAFVDDVKSACIMQIMEVRVGLTYT